MTIIKKNTKKTNNLKTNKQKTKPNFFLKHRSIEIVLKSLLHMYFPKKIHSNGYFNFCQAILRLFQIILLIKEDGS
jgi:hypothetical protein